MTISKHNSIQFSLLCGFLSMSKQAQSILRIRSYTCRIQSWHQITCFLTSDSMNLNAVGKERGQLKKVRTIFANSSSHNKTTIAPSFYFKHLTIYWKSLWALTICWVHEYGLKQKVMTAGHIFVNSSYAM